MDVQLEWFNKIIHVIKLEQNIFSSFHGKDLITMGELSCALSITGKPQLLGLGSDIWFNNAHAVLVYAITVNQNGYVYHVYDNVDNSQVYQINYDTTMSKFENYRGYTEFVYIGAQTFVSKNAMQQIYDKYLPKTDVSDTTTPTLVSFSVSPTSIDVSSSSQEVQLTFEVTDDLSGLAISGSGCSGHVSGIIFKSPSGDQDVKANNCSFTLQSGTVNDGVFTTTLTFPQYAESGTWKLSGIILEDQAGNTDFINETALTQLGISASVDILYL